jgi:hypothetical protein
MAVAAVKTTTENIAENISTITTEVPVLAQKFREQFVSNLHQGQQLSVDATQTWVKAVSLLPTVDLPRVHGIPMPDVEAATKFTFDVAADVLSAQREFVLNLASALVPAKTV